MATFESSSSLESADALYKKATIRKNSQVMQVVVFSTAAVTKDFRALFGKTRVLQLVHELIADCSCYSTLSSDLYPGGYRKG